MATDHRQVRLEKLQSLRDAGVEPYPYRFDRSHLIGEIRENWDHLEGEAQSDEPVRAAGRITNWRNMGKTIFADLHDQSGRVQAFLNKKLLGDDAFAQLKLCDLGDWLGVSGHLFRTRTGELSVRVENAEVLCKSLRPLPEKHHGLQNPELIYRDRSAYFASAPEARDVFVMRSKAITAIREFMTGRGYMEMETPLLQPVYGGAAARPFKTHVWAIDNDYYLQISPELYLKRLICGGFDKVFTVSKNFRNEGIDKTHNPEFTMMESYEAYADYRDIMELTENLYAHVFRTVRDTTKVEFGGGDDGEESIELDFEPPWPRLKMLDLVNEHTGIDVGALDAEGLRSALRDLPDNDPFLVQEVPKGELDKWSWGKLVQALFEFHAEHKLIQPCFVIDHPVESTPLCKIHREDPRLIERFEPFANGWEIGNAYSELNDPVRQRQLLEQQSDDRDAGDEEANPLDEDFLAAIDLGMPPTGGLGIGVDRMIMLLTNRANIKDVILFPFTGTGQQRTTQTDDEESE